MTIINSNSNIQVPKSHSSNDKYKNVPKPYLDIAQGMETQFISNMMKEMNKTVISEKPDNSSTKYYKSLLDHERAKIMAGTDNGIGLKDLILDQIAPQYMQKHQASAKQAIKMYQQKADSRLGDGHE